MNLRHALIAVTIAGVAASPSFSDADDFKTGPLINQYGPATLVPGAEPLAANTVFNVAFDVTTRGEEGAINRKFESAARFLNMHAAVGVAAENMKLAVVVHGPAVLDMTNDMKYGGANKNADLIKVLLANGVSVHVCGQSAAFQNVKAEDLLPGVKMAVSAMTAHALLQQQGYTLNPF